ncbi:hypothetical protein [Botrimarina mediterranea]|uniref:PEP-CTERM protein-sorting domain-containing protein n=1 Tax=Botrimarina mediterranea TaxID=2528022 RepID=A0A518KBP7_9BACT|nr:hypothetical protein [Botrimarina mediterranea]QDV75222.1 hypothetical protein Spa11_34360 [Botrimarina mediterranea]QDV79891.1 hypothetical protein K2D_35110 [Planctomycetes bacterium K2D]
MRLPLGLAAAVIALSASSDAGAVSAHFWLSTSAVATPGPSNADVGATLGVTTRLYVWGRPTAGRQFEAVSLNVVATGPEVDFVDGSFLFYNQIDGSTDRFEYVVDSTTTPTLGSEYNAFELGLGGVTDGLYGLNGFNLTATAPRGPGPVCASGEIGCVVAGDGQPAWLIASFEAAAIDAGSADLHLQIGDRGVVERITAVGDYDLLGTVDQPDHATWTAGYGAVGLHAADGNLDGVVDAADYTVWRDHIGGVSQLLGVAATTVRFGEDLGGLDEPAHNALTDRDLNLPGDDADATFTIAAPALSVPEPATALMAAVALMPLIRKRGACPTEIFSWR